MHILVNVSRSKGNQTMKLSKLMEYNMRTIFLKNPQNVVSKLFPDFFLKNQNWTYLWINSLKFHTVFFFFVCSVEVYQIILKRSCRPLAFTSYKACLKNKKRSGTSLPASFFAWFLKNIFLLLYPNNLQIS